MGLMQGGVKDFEGKFFQEDSLTRTTLPNRQVSRWIDMERIDCSDRSGPTVLLVDCEELLRERSSYASSDRNFRTYRSYI
jgi:hypothetical protein